VSDAEKLPDLEPEHRAHLWQLGWPVHRLFRHQFELSEAFNTSSARVFVVKCARRFGKSWWLCIEMLGFALRNPNARLLYLAPTAKQVRMIIEPHMHSILAECPAHLRPEHRRQDGQWNFPNGSILYMAGVDNGNAERLRGIETHLAGLDEPGSMSDLEYVVQSIVLPQTLTTDGRIVMIGTPPVQPAHDFARIYCARAAAEGRLVEKTIHDARHISPERIAEYAKEEGGEDSITWRREYLAEDVYDTESAVVPEFARNESVLVEERERPRYVNRYVIGDIGFVDLSFWLFCYVDFDDAVLVVEDELVFQHKAASDQAAELLAKERALWGDLLKPPVRLCDAELLVLAEFSRADRRFAVGPVDNKDPDATVNRLRLATQRHQYRIDPRCRQLIAHVKSATWNKQRTSFERVDGFGHFDGVAALMYAVKHANIHGQSPYPALPEGANAADWKLPPQQSKGADGWGALKRRRSGR
jgi:hypothetical protein